MSFRIGNDSITQRDKAGTITLGQLIAMGEIENATDINKFGFNPSVGAAFETVWDAGGTYSFLASPQLLTVTSQDETPANDNGVQVTLEGLDGNYEALSETVTLAGLGTATTQNTFLRIHRAYIANGQAPGDDILIEYNSVTYAQITYDYNQTLMAVYTVPAGYTAYLQNLRVGIGKQKEVIARLQVREFGGIFRTRALLSSFGAPIDKEWTVPEVYPEKTDFMVMATANAVTDISASFEIILVENT